MLRPEHLTVHAQRPTGESLEARVTDVVFQGASVRVVARTTDGTEVAALVSGQAGLPFLVPGASVWLSWGTDAVYALPGWPEVAGATTTDVDRVEAGL